MSLPPTPAAERAAPPAHLADGVCGSCAHFALAGAALGHLGFGRCAFMPAWHELSRRSACRFNPSRWSALA
ncbi:hypothetical protein [Tibeticola sp.]|uniref:hypothetical protein n=1 Tax=Tibeticola sp. TaxID=2005368 RepID=UPI0025E4A801|nr:hypothetical protein [Tibeticola sp.]